MATGHTVINVGHRPALFHSSLFCSLGFSVRIQKSTGRVGSKKITRTYGSGRVCREVMEEIRRSGGVAAGGRSDGCLH